MAEFRNTYSNDDLPVQVVDVSIAYGDNPPILENISFSVEPGEILGILGGSGCGKSSLLKNLIGLEKPAKGKIFIFGEDLWANEGANLNKIRRKFGMMYQGGALFGSLSLLENVAFPLANFTDLSKGAIFEVARLKLALVGLNGFESHLPSQISGGMQKRVAIARAMALDPKLIFLDEPSAGLDPITASELDKLIIELSENLNVTFIVVTHELGSIYNLLDWSIMLDRKAKGIIAEGKPAELAKETKNPTVHAFFNRKDYKKNQGKITEN